MANTKFLEKQEMMQQVKTFDKVARAIGLGYPGGPKIDKSQKKATLMHMIFQGQK